MRSSHFVDVFVDAFDAIIPVSTTEMKLCKISSSFRFRRRWKRDDRTECKCCGERKED